MQVIRLAHIALIEGVTRRAVYERYRDRLIYIRAQGPGGKVGVVPTQLLPSPHSYKKYFFEIQNQDVLKNNLETQIADCEFSADEIKFVDEEKSIAIIRHHQYVDAAKIRTAIGYKNLRCVHIKATRENWQFVKIPGTGNGKKLYLFDSLPVDVQINLQTNNPQSDVQYQSKALNPQSEILYSQTTDKQRRKANVWTDILPAWQQARKVECALKSKQEIDDDFVAAWNTANEFKISRASLHRKFKDYEKQGLDGLVGKYSPEARWQAEWPNEAKWMLEDLYLDENKPEMYDCYAIMCGTAKAKGWPMPSFATARRYLLTLDKDKVARLRGGYKHYDDRAFPSILRNIATIRVGQLYVCDARLIDVSYGGGREGYRLWLFAWADAKSKKIVGREYRDSGNDAQAVLDSFYMGAADCLPESVYLDNGTDMIIAGYTRKADMSLPASLKAPLELLLTAENVRYARFKNAKTKIIERIFGLIAEKCDKKFPGYTGINVYKRPEKWSIDRKDKRFLEKSELMDIIDHYIFDVYNNWAPRDKKQSPNEIWEEYFSSHSKRRIDDETLRHILLPVHKNPKSSDGMYKINRHGIGIVINGRLCWYWADWISRLPAKQKVYVKLHHADPSRIWIYDAEGRPMGEVPAYEFGNVDYLNGGKAAGKHQEIKQKRNKEIIGYKKSLKEKHGVDISIRATMARNDIHEFPDINIDKETGEYRETVEHIEIDFPVPGKAKDLDKKAKNAQRKEKRLDEKIEAAIDEKLAVHPEPDAFDVWSKVDAILQKKRAVNE